ncbi:hypothetical protein [Bradyrhizobium neotropicale]|uniref:hypothetical protein n=1 Tax=Bradyrhizobium neotropicale TaxID=1497615 RepID=UPI001AD71649|nr:hypothetical protein [Bradyrhizobium neotropicale]MBO4227573.1 hypothetical protein [Bradyrhizobium neotropicale]
MDRNIQLRHLEQAEQHVRRGEKHIADQEQRIADLELLGHNTKSARSLLQTFRLVQAEHVAHRDRILKALRM